MPSLKMKSHKGLKKRFKVTASGKVLHKPCGSSHLNSHKSGKKIRQLRRKKALKVRADAQRIRHALLKRELAAVQVPGVAATPEATPEATEPSSSPPPST